MNVEPGTIKQNKRKLHLVTVGVPTYNRPLKLQKTLFAIQQQTYKNLEIIISDNNSVENQVYEIANDFCLSDTRASYFRQKVNVGATENFNLLKNKAKGKYFLWLADDDHIETDYIEKCVNFLENNPGFVLVSGVAHLYKPDKSCYNAEDINLESNSPINRVKQYVRIVHTNSVFYGVYRLDMIKNISIRNVLGGDWCYLMEVAFMGKIKTIPTTAIHREASHLNVDDPWKVLIKSYGKPEWMKEVPAILIALEVVYGLKLRSFNGNFYEFVMLYIYIYRTIVKSKFKRKKTIKVRLLTCLCILDFICSKAIKKVVVTSFK